MREYDGGAMHQMLHVLNLLTAETVATTALMRPRRSQMTINMD